VIRTHAVRVSAAAVIVAAGFTGGSLAGRALGPIDLGHRATWSHPTPPVSGGAGGGGPSGDGAGAGDRAGDRAGGSGGAGDGDHAVGDDRRALAPPVPGGLLASQSGYTLQPGTTALTGVAGETFSFRIVDPVGTPVHRFTPEHERLLHLVLVSRNLLVYLHLHPTLAPDGTWSVELPVLPPAQYRAYASFVVTGGPALTLSVDLLVPGVLTALALPETGPEVTADRYTVRLDGTPTAGAPAMLRLTVARDGHPVRDLDPYLGARGHLVAIRAGDLFYSHVHPADTGGGGAAVPFHVELPGPGDYRLFFDFSHRGQVHTAAFTVHVLPQR
jgi:hypothetical protein